MEIQEVAERLNARFPGVVKSVETAHAGDPFLSIDPPRIAEVCRFLRDDREHSYEWLMCLSGVDYPPDQIAVVYHLHSQTHGRKLTLKALLDRAAPALPTVEPVWKMAGWHERECYDMLGVHFEGHPDLRRILLPFDWEGHPLRKDYVYPESYRGVTNKP
ncbi:MAG: NADH-quinone oxidoreductase subunit C [Candidatus Eisenbacteria bacterium]|nr:NADH-quinone oxidoreductase subunit C [Candidatus Eisenbacteria bacterium]